MSIVRPLMIATLVLTEVGLWQWRMVIAARGSRRHEASLHRDVARLAPEAVWSTDLRVNPTALADIGGVSTSDVIATNQ